MSELYCPHCGHKNIYNLNRPKFCNNCGESFFTKAEQAKSSAKVVKTVKKRPLHQEDYDEEGTDVFHVPTLSRGLAFDVSYEQNKISGKDIVGDYGEIEENIKPKKRRGRPPKQKNNSAKEKTDLRRKHRDNR